MMLSKGNNIVLILCLFIGKQGDFYGDEQRKALEDVIQISRNVKPIYWVWLTIRDDAVHRVILVRWFRLPRQSGY